MYKIFIKELGWKPDELRRQRASDVLNIMAIVETEGRVARMRKRASNSGKLAGYHPKAGR